MIGQMINALRSLTTTPTLSAALLSAALLPLTACKPSAVAPVPPMAQGEAQGTGDGHAGHDHAEHAHGPHEGEIVELGGGAFHAEVVHDHAARRVTVYLLGEDLKSAVPNAKDLLINVVADGKPQQHALAATPGEAREIARFELVDESLCDALDVKDAQARLTVTIDGNSYSGDLTAGAHDDLAEHGHE